jgi:hypothetical protein
LPQRRPLKIKHSNFKSISILLNNMPATEGSRANPLATVGSMALCCVPKAMRCKSWNDFKTKVLIGAFLILVVIVVGALTVLVAWAAHQRKLLIN